MDRGWSLIRVGANRRTFSVRGARGAKSVPFDDLDIGMYTITFTIPLHEGSTNGRIEIRLEKRGTGKSIFLNSQWIIAGDRSSVLHSVHWISLGRCA